MPIVFKSTLSSAVTNATFYDKTIDDATIGRLDLNNILAESGSSITNTQRQINRNTVLVPNAATVASGGDITLDVISMHQIRKVSGTGGAAILDVQPFGVVIQPLEGTIIVLVGTNDTNTIKFLHNDAQYGCWLNGDATLSRGDILQLYYDSSLERYVEIGRNF